jgi:hypothetical protein
VLVFTPNVVKAGQATGRAGLKAAGTRFNLEMAANTYAVVLDRVLELTESIGLECC